MVTFVTVTVFTVRFRSAVINVILPEPTLNGVHLKTQSKIHSKGNNTVLGYVTILMISWQLSQYKLWNYISFILNDLFFIQICVYFLQAITVANLEVTKTLSMYTEQFQVILAIFLHINGLTFGRHSSQADVIDNCTSSTSCIHNYEQVYQSFTKSDNSYNISYALYPGRLKPSSVHVFVNVYGLGPNKFIKNSTPAKYTWSMSCLYATIPSVVLEVLSLGAILVTLRTQELNLQIPLFCCNVSENKEDRKRKIDEMLTRAIADVSYNV